MPSSGGAGLGGAVWGGAWWGRSGCRPWGAPHSAPPAERPAGDGLVPRVDPAREVDAQLPRWLGETNRLERHGRLEGRRIPHSGCEGIFPGRESCHARRLEWSAPERARKMQRRGCARHTTLGHLAQSEKCDAVRRRVPCVAARAAPPLAHPHPQPSRPNYLRNGVRHIPSLYTLRIPLSNLTLPGLSRPPALIRGGGEGAWPAVETQCGAAPPCRPHGRTFRLADGDFTCVDHHMAPPSPSPVNLPRRAIRAECTAPPHSTRCCSAFFFFFLPSRRNVSRYVRCTNFLTPSPCRVRV